MFLEDVSSEPLWYVVHTYSGYENKVKTSLERAIENRGMKDYFFDIIIPMIEEEGESDRLPDNVELVSWNKNKYKALSQTVGRFARIIKEVFFLECLIIENY